jgi:hypothetical protein
MSSESKISVDGDHSPTTSGAPDDLDPSTITTQQMREALQAAVPFNVHVGVTIQEASPTRGIATLSDVPHVRNHLGTIHGGALLAVAEAAAGAAYVGALREQVQHVRMNLQGVDIAYRKWARGTILASSTLGRDPSSVLADLGQAKRLEITMLSVVKDQADSILAEMTFRFLLKSLGE